MKLIIDTDYYDDDEFESLVECLERRNIIKNKLKKLENGTLKEIELEMDRNVCCYLTGKNLKENEDFIKKFLELAMASNERDINTFKERLGVEEV